METDRFSAIEHHPPLHLNNLSAECDASADKVKLSWKMDNTARLYVHHVNIHRSLTPDFTPAYTNMVGQSKGLTFTDDIGNLDLPVYYIIQAEDNVGEYEPITAIMVG
jgi:hypothetical protein